MQRLLRGACEIVDTDSVACATAEDSWGCCIKGLVKALLDKKFWNSCLF